MTSDIAGRTPPSARPSRTRTACATATCISTSQAQKHDLVRTHNELAESVNEGSAHAHHSKQDNLQRNPRPRPHRPAHDVGRDLPQRVEDCKSPSARPKQDDQVAVGLTVEDGEGDVVLVPDQVEIGLEPGDLGAEVRGEGSGSARAPGRGRRRSGQSVRATSITHPSIAHVGPVDKGLPSNKGTIST
jgi:hypothetical protein